MLSAHSRHCTCVVGAAKVVEVVFFRRFKRALNDGLVHIRVRGFDSIETELNERRNEMKPLDRVGERDYAARSPDSFYDLSCRRSGRAKRLRLRCFEHVFRDVVWRGNAHHPDSEFIANFRDAEWEKVSASSASSVNDGTYSLSFQEVANNASLKFIANSNAIMAAWNGLSGATIKINGGNTQPLSLTTSGAYLETAIAAGQSLTAATAQIHIPAVTVNAGEDNAVTYAAADFTIRNISQAGPTAPDPNEGGSNEE